MARVLVLSPHPDDETLGCGGTLCRHADEGDEIRVVFLTSGEHGGHGMSPDETRLRREAEAARATRILGVRHIEFWRSRDGGLRADDAIVARLAATLRDQRPEFVYTTHAAEMHRDHRAALRILCRALGLAQHSTTVRLFEIWTPLQRLDEIVDITPWMATKLRAVRTYRSQNAALRFDDAVTGLNRYRGEMHSWPGGDYAEVFEVLRT